VVRKGCQLLLLTSEAAKWPSLGLVSCLALRCPQPICSALYPSLASVFTCTTCTPFTQSTSIFQHNYRIAVTPLNCPCSSGPYAPTAWQRQCKATIRTVTHGMNPYSDTTGGQPHLVVVHPEHSDGDAAPHLSQTAVIPHLTAITPVRTDPGARSLSRGSNGNGNGGRTLGSPGTLRGAGGSFKAGAARADKGLPCKGRSVGRRRRAAPIASSAPPPPPNTLSAPDIANRGALALNVPALV